MLLELFLGVVAALVTLVSFRYMKSSNEANLYKIALIVAAFIYVCFSLQSGNLAWVLVETGGIILFTAIAIAGFQLSPWLLVVGWLAHPIWDFSLHSSTTTPFVPGWYPTACVGYDLVIAVYVAFQCKHWRLARENVQTSTNL